MRSPVSFEDLKDKNFTLRMGKIAGDTVVLIVPRVNIKWSKNLLFYRSSVWTRTGDLVSAGFKKFFNLHEATGVVPDPTDNDVLGGEFIEKLDGSLLIASKYKGETIIRTRGTLDASVLDNGHEIAVLKKKYPKCFNNKWLDNGYSILYEWLSNTNKIILDYPNCPDIKMVGAISHQDYSYVSQLELDEWAIELDVSRPKRYPFNSMKDMLAAVEGLQDQEGLCFYYNAGQDIKKIKSPWYLALHRFKSSCSLDYVLDFYLGFGEPSLEEFTQKITEVFDYECFTVALPFALKVIEANRKANIFLEDMQAFVEQELKILSTRKEQAQKVMDVYGKTAHIGLVFTLLDGKKLTISEKKKIYLQFLEKRS